MSRFDESIQHILDIEGGFVNDPDDRGGATKWGITLSFYKTHIDSSATIEDIRDLTRSEAKEIYRNYFWNPAKFAVGGKTYSDLPVGVDSFVLSMAINMGWRQAHTLLQKAIVAAGEDVTIDGWLGPESINGASSVHTKRLIEKLGVKASVFYAQIVLGDRSQQKFLEGWMHRAFSETIRSVIDLEC